MSAMKNELAFPPIFWASRQQAVNVHELGQVPFTADQLLDRMLIAETFNRFGTGHDENLVDVVASCMTEDVSFEVARGSATPFAVFNGRAALHARLSHGIKFMYGQRRHCVTNLLIESLTATEAVASAYGIVSRAADGIVLQATVMYAGNLRKEADGYWRFSRFFIGMDDYLDEGTEEEDRDY